MLWWLDSSHIQSLKTRVRHFTKSAQLVCIELFSFSGGWLLLAQIYCYDCVSWCYVILIFQDQGFHLKLTEVHLRSGPQPEGGNRAISPSKFSQTYVFVRCSNKLHHFAPPLPKKAKPLRPSLRRTWGTHPQFSYCEQPDVYSFLLWCLFHPDKLLSFCSLVNWSKQEHQFHTNLHSWDECSPDFLYQQCFNFCCWFSEILTFTLVYNYYMLLNVSQLVSDCQVFSTKIQLFSVLVCDNCFHFIDFI